MLIINIIYDILLKILDYDFKEILFLDTFLLSFL